MLSTRVLSAAVFTPALMVVVIAGGFALQLCCAMLSLGMLFEALRLMLPSKGRQPFVIVSFIAGAGHVACNTGLMECAPAPAASACVLLLLAALLTPGPLSVQVSAAAGAHLAIAYATGLLPLLWQLRQRPDVGLGLCLLAVMCTFASDTGAYFAGRAFGRRKLYPRISPGKTLEGACGGLLAAMLSAWAICLWGPWPLGLAQAITLGLIAAVLGILGDLCESLLKRQAGVKDSSQLIPGHGGLLDRFDGVLFALFGIEAYTTWVLKL